MDRHRPLAKVMKLIILPALLVVVAGLIPSAAYAGTRTANQLWSNLTGKYVIAVPGASRSSGVQLETWASEGHPDQFWTFDSTFFNVQEIVNVNSGLCMGVQGGSTALGAPIVQATCNGAPDQQWALGGNDGAFGADFLGNENGLCLGIAGNSTSQGAKLVQWTCDGNADKFWIPDSAPWPLGDNMGNHWYACIGGNPGECTNNPPSDTDPINVVFNDPNRDALSDIESDLEIEGWAVTTCFNPQVQFNPNQSGGITRVPDAVLATDVSNDGCGADGSVRDHVRIWISPDGHTAFMAASTERVSCGVLTCSHSVVSFTDGRNELINDEDARLSSQGGLNFLSNEVMQYPASSLSNVSFDGFVGVFQIGA